MHDYFKFIKEPENYIHIKPQLFLEFIFVLIKFKFCRYYKNICSFSKEDKTLMYLSQDNFLIENIFDRQISYDFCTTSYFQLLKKKK